MGTVKSSQPMRSASELISGIIKGLRTYRSTNAFLGILLALPATIVICMIIGRPLLANFRDSFFELEGIVGGGKWIYVGLANFRKIIQDEIVLNALKNTLFLTFVTTPLTVILSIILALLLENDFFGRRFVRTTLILPWAMPVIVSAFAWRFMADPGNGIFNQWLLSLGILNKPLNWLAFPNTTWLILISANVWKGLPFMLLVTIAALKQVPGELYDSAKVDGASFFGVFWHVTWPCIRGIIAFAIVLRAIWYFNWFDLVWLITGGGPGRSTEILPIVVFRTAFRELKWGRASAIASLMFIILLIMVFIFWKVMPKSEEAQK